MMEAFQILPDPQTNGGLLIAVDPNEVETFYSICKEYQHHELAPIGRIIQQEEKGILVQA